jgi:Protein of unknown function (DUF3892)
MISEYIISCVKKNDQGDIVKVGIDGELFDVKTIAEKILARENSYFIIAMGIRVRIFAMRDPRSNELYLTSTTNEKLPNSLNFLPRCI